MTTKQQRNKLLLQLCANMVYLQSAIPNGEIPRALFLKAAEETIPLLNDLLVILSLGKENGYIQETMHTRPTRLFVLTVTPEGARQAKRGRFISTLFKAQVLALAHAYGFQPTEAFMQKSCPSKTHRERTRRNKAVYTNNRKILEELRRSQCALTALSPSTLPANAADRKQRTVLNNCLEKIAHAIRTLERENQKLEALEDSLPEQDPLPW